MSSIPHTKRRLDLMLIGVFALMLLLPTIWSVCRFPEGKSMDEHRVLARFPGFHGNPYLLQKFCKDLEKYYDDHFGGRAILIACRLKIERTLFPELSTGQMIGRDGWFFYTGDNMIDNFLGYTKAPRSELKVMQAQLEERRDKLAARGIKYLVVIAPNKESIYPDYLPGWLKPSTTRMDQFVEYMRLHSTVEILDLRPVLRNARKHDPVFYKTDTHWNMMGAFAAYQAIMSKLSGQIPGLAPLAASDFKLKRTRGMDGDLARIAGEPALIEDNMYAFAPKRRLPKLKIYYDGTHQINLSRLGSLPVVEHDGLTTINSRLSTHVLIYGDSFATELIPYLGYSFGKVTVSYGVFRMSDIDRDKPVLVIDEKVERLFNETFGWPAALARYRP